MDRVAKRKGGLLDMEESQNWQIPSDSCADRTDIVMNRLIDFDLLDEDPQLLCANHSKD
jgi:hypothetical protein